jgi:lysyl-tRNA synthetase, class II
MSRALIRRSVGLWLGAMVAVVGWIVADLAMMAAVLGVALAVSLAGGALRRLRRRGDGGRWPRIDLLSVPVAGIWWVLAAAAAVAAPAARAIRAARGLHPLGGASAVALGHTHAITQWGTVLDLLLGGALVSSLFAARALRRPGRLQGDASQTALDRARAIVADHGEDSLSPYVLRPDKEFQLARDGLVAFSVVGETVVISADPVGTPEGAAEALRTLVQRAHQAGLKVAAYGASDRHLDVFRGLGLRAVRAGDEAVVDPREFTLDGRPVRKLRQAVHRLERRGWRVTIHEGRKIDGELEAAIDAVEAQWRARQDRILGFAMGMGEFELAIRADDLYVLAWSPASQLQGVMRFVAHRDKLSLDTMRRVGETPNGLNEALVCRALEHARGRGIREVSLNYAGLAHLIRVDAAGNRLSKALARRLLRPVRGRFQMDRLVLFNQKFSPQWRPRYLVFESRAGLLRAVLRVLQAEGYLSRRPARSRRSSGRWSAPSSATVKDGVGQ